MSTLAIRKGAWDAGTDVQRAILRKACGRLDLGQPALFNGAGADWFIFDDDRIDLTDVAYLGTLCKGLAQLPTDADPTRQDVIDYVTGRVVLPKDIPGLADAVNPYQAVLDAQNAPAWVKASDSVPSTWSPVAT